MLIVNYIKHLDPIPVFPKKKVYEIASFGIEFIVGDIKLTWNGWSIRVKGTHTFLMAPQLNRFTTLLKGPVVTVGAIPHDAFLSLIRDQLLIVYGVKIDEPKKNNSIKSDED